MRPRSASASLARARWPDQGPSDHSLFFVVFVCFNSFIGAGQTGERAWLNQREWPSTPHEEQYRFELSSPDPI
ncbi:hypothetical protein NDU88_002850 [Pleurodeles waltl]|uniref:Secreted protein n=1 Tax=Pleurodeles waltl TaxID=8319 RepID=A0AAV7M3L0_PLEWA|nr:hypothetical protein NDU88_002850 [Pleurodeles waltl]